MVVKVLTSVVRVPSAWSSRAQATTVFLCTSSPAHCAYTTCIAHLHAQRTVACWLARCRLDTNLTCVLGGWCRLSQRSVPFGIQVKLMFRLAALQTHRP